MRKKIMTLFYTVASGLIIAHLGTQFAVMNKLQSGSQIMYITSQAKQDLAEETQSVDYSKWGHKYGD